MYIYMLICHSLTFFNALTKPSILHSLSLHILPTHTYTYMHTRMHSRTNMPMHKHFDRQGEFIQTCQIFQDWYGLTMAAVEQVAQQGLACVTHLSLQVCIILIIIHDAYANGLEVWITRPQISFARHRNVQGVLLLCTVC